VWTTLAPDAAAVQLGEERSRILAALEYLDQQGLVELQPSDVRQRYTLLTRPSSDAELVDSLLDRFARRERAEIARIENVLALVTHDGCQVCSLVGYFGETRTEPCGHCSHCLTGCAQTLPPREPNPPIETIVRAEAFAALRDGHPDALGTPRQQARFLAGITSPATSRSKLTRDPLFGSLAERRFNEVLAWRRSGGI
jgi:ATP-dependent DNA helicase RecQ